jgi:Domain of unknown function (DUF4062)
MDTVRRIPIFIASPNDVSAERRVFKETIVGLNKGFARGARVEFVPVEWEDQLAETGRRVQDVLNQRIAECDLFVLVLHARWGRKDDNSSYSSYTEEEYETAMSLWRKTGSPKVLIFFKSVPSAQLADPGDQLKPVVAFKKKLQEAGDVLYRSFDNEQQFGEEIDKHLCAYAEDGMMQLAKSPPAVVFSPSVGEGIEQSPAPGRPSGPPSTAPAPPAAAAPAVQRPAHADVDMAREAMEAARQGRVEDARVRFAQAVQVTSEPAVLKAAADFYEQVGEYDNVIAMMQKMAAVLRGRKDAAEQYLQLIPPGYVDRLLKQTIEALLQQAPPEEREEVESICQEIYGDGKFEKMMAEVMTRFYTMDEIVFVTSYMIHPLALSLMEKQPAMMLAMMEFGQREFLRVARERHPEAFEPDTQPAELPADTRATPQLSAGSKEEVSA